jgi:two-component system cell cycle response regulator CtrA
LSEATEGDNYIETVWGRGYVLRDPEPAVEIDRMAVTA